MLGWMLSGPISRANRECSTVTAVYGFQCFLDSELLDVLQRLVGDLVSERGCIAQREYADRG